MAYSSKYLSPRYFAQRFFAGIRRLIVPLVGNNKYKIQHNGPYLITESALPITHAAPYNLSANLPPKIGHNGPYAIQHSGPFEVKL